MLYVDPRDNPPPRLNEASLRTTLEPGELSELHFLCRHGRLYDVERWVQAGHPLQISDGCGFRRRRTASALEIALKAENHALVLLLLCNGYDPNLEPDSPLDLSLRARRWDLLDLLLDWGADPHKVGLEELFGTYQSKLFERFYALAVDLTADHALADTLAHHTSNKPLFGFARRHRERAPKIQGELDIALAHHADAGNEKGVQLCLWAGANPHAPVPSLRYGAHCGEEQGDGGEEGSRFNGFSAIWQACSSGHASILERLSPDPARDDYDDLYCATRSEAVISYLARKALPCDPGAVIHSQITRITWSTGLWSSTWGSVYTLQRLFEVGVRWKGSSPGEIAAVRSALLKISDSTFEDLIKLLATADYCSPEILKEIGRTPAMRARMKKVGFLPPSGDGTDPYGRHRPTRSREVLSKFGLEPPKPKKTSLNPPPVVQIGPRRRDGREIRLDRAALFDCVWSTPVMKLAEEWGISGPGLAKACRRIQVPVPPRGYWAKVEAGRSMRRPLLPPLKPGQAEEIVIWAPE